MRVGRRALLGAILGAGAAVIGGAVAELNEPRTELAGPVSRARVICGWPTDMARGLMPCVLAPDHPGGCLPAAPPMRQL